MKFKFKVDRIEQRNLLVPKANPADGVESAVVTMAKLVPLDAPVGDLLVAVPFAEIEYHPETLEDHPREPGIKRVAIAKNTLIRSVSADGQSLVVGETYDVDITPSA